jgi:hypothetical protein
LTQIKVPASALKITTAEVNHRAPRTASPHRFQL